MKILIIRNAWKATDFGGAEDLAINLVKELNVQGVGAILVSGTPSVVEVAKNNNLPFIKGPFSNRQILTKHRAVFVPKYLLDLHSAYRQYLKLFNNEKPDVIHATGQQDSIAATAAAKKLNIPVMWSDHGELKNSIRPSFMPPWGIPGDLLKRQLKKVDALLMVNLADVNFVKALNTNVPINIVPNGVVDNKKSKQNLTHDLVFASRIIREKGIFELIDAFENISKELPKTTLLVSGDGPSLTSVKGLVNQRALKNITFKPYTDDAIENAWIFVLPTYTEAQSLAILKAMMYQKPIVTTNIDGNTHFLAHNSTAVLVEPKNSDSLAEGIMTLLRDSKKSNEIALNARKQYEQSNELSKIVLEFYIPTYVKLTKK